MGRPRVKRPVEGICHRCDLHVWLAEDDTYAWQARHRCIKRRTEADGRQMRTGWTAEEDVAVRAAIGTYGEIKRLAARLGRTYESTAKRSSILQARDRMLDEGLLPPNLASDRPLAGSPTWAGRVRGRARCRPAFCRVYDG